MHGPGGTYEQLGWPQPANGSASESVQGLHAAAFLSAAPTASHGHAWGVTPEQAPRGLHAAGALEAPVRRDGGFKRQLPECGPGLGPGWSRRDPAGPTGVILGP